MMEAGFGETLRQAREMANLTLEQVEDETKIRKYYLNALEEENFSALPARAYATGFVRKYSEFLGLNPDEMARSFRELSSGRMPEDEETRTIVAPKEESMMGRFPMRNIAAGIIFLIVALWAGNYLANYISQRSASNNPSTQQPAVSEKNHKTTKPSTPSTPAPTKVSELKLSMKAAGDCWYLVTLDQGNPEEGIIKAGEEKTFTASNSLHVKLGNAGAVAVNLNGKDYGKLGGPGEVISRDFTLEELRQQT